MMKDNKGIAHLAALMAIVIILAIGGVGYYVAKHQKSITKSQSSAAVAPTLLKTTTSLVAPNGTVANLTTQLDTSDNDEAKAEDAAMAAEEAASKLDQAQIDNVKGGVDAASL